MFAIGEKVKIVKKVEEFSTDRWVKGMDPLIGKEGEVVSSGENNTVFILSIPGVIRRYVFPLESLERAIKQYYYLEGTTLLFEKVATGSKYCVYEDYRGNSFISDKFNFIEAPKGVAPEVSKEEEHDDEEHDDEEHDDEEHDDEEHDDEEHDDEEHDDDYEDPDQPRF